MLYVRFLLSFLSQKRFLSNFPLSTKNEKFSLFPDHPSILLCPTYILDLVEPASSQIVGNDHVRHGVEDKLNVLSVGGAGHVTVDLLRGRLVLRLELSLDVGGRLSVLLGA